jgi:hypothetical protein
MKRKRKPTQARTAAGSGRARTAPWRRDALLGNSPDQVISAFKIGDQGESGRHGWVGREQSVSITVKEDDVPVPLPTRSFRYRTTRCL